MGELIDARTLASSDKIKEKFKEVLGNEHKYFMQSVVNSISNNPSLLKCDGKSVWSAAMNSAVLGLPIDNNLSYAAIVPFKGKAQFQIMIRGYIQLAIDTGLYKNIHVTEVYDDELDYHDPLRNKTHFTDKALWKQRYGNDSTKIVGFFAFLELNNGFYKEMYMSKEEVEAHGKQYSQTFTNPRGLWQTNFHAMAKKTVLKNLIRQYGILGRRDTQKLARALDLDQGFIDEFGSDEIKYYDNPNASESDDIEIEVEEDFKDSPLEG